MLTFELRDAAFNLSASAWPCGHAHGWMYWCLRAKKTWLTEINQIDQMKEINEIIEISEIKEVNEIYQGEQLDHMTSSRPNT